MPEQRIISFDATTLNTYQNCARKTKLAFIELLTPNIKAEALEKGDLFHKIIEVYYGLKHAIVRPDSDTWVALREAGLAPVNDSPLLNNPEIEVLIPYCKEVGQFFASQMDAKPEDLEEVIYQFEQYADFYRHDEWHPLAVEEVGSRILFEDELWKIVYNIKCDLVAEKGSRLAPWDHKTGSRRQTPSSLANQFIGTCFVMGTNFMMINKIGFQKSLSTSERFQRFLLNISNTRIEEWVNNTIIWGKRLYESIHSDLWEMNLTSCDKYSGCVYRSVCEAPPENRVFQIERDFREGNKWDVAQILET